MALAEHDGREAEADAGCAFKDRGRPPMRAPAKVLAREARFRFAAPGEPCEDIATTATMVSR